MSPLTVPLSLSLSLWLSLASPLLTVDGTSLCPTPKEVGERVAALLPGTLTNEARDVVHVDDVNGAVRVRLQRPDGRIVGERVLERRFGCPDLAAAAAVVVAAWESDVHPEFVRNLQTPPTPPPLPPPRLPPPPIAPAAVDVGLALTGGLAPDTDSAHPALGGMAAATWVAGGQTIGARLAALATTDRTLTLSSGDVHWRRTALAAGGLYRLSPPTRRWWLDLQANLLVAQVRMQGVGFVRNLSDSGLDPGIGVGGRWLLRTGRVSPWLELAGTGWLRRQVVFETPSMTARGLPRLEATLAVGVSICSAP